MNARYFAIASLVAACASAPPAPPPAQPAVAVPSSVATGAEIAARAPTMAEGALLRIWGIEEARAGVLVSISIPAFDRTMATATELARPLSPIPPESLREMLMSQVGLPAGVMEALDTTSPMGLALVTVEAGKDPGIALAVPAKSAELAERAVTAMGRVVGKRGEARQLENDAGGKRIWVWRPGAVVVIADSAGALERGANAALESRRGGDEDVTLHLSPDTIARHGGTDVKTALARAAGELRGSEASVAVQRDLLSHLDGADSVQIGLRLDVAKGITLGARLHARPGTALAGAARDAKPFAPDAALFGGADLAAVGMTRRGLMTDGYVQAARTHLTSAGPGKAAALRFVEAMFEGARGPTSVALRGKTWLDLEVTVGMKDAASAGKVQSALLGLDSAAVAALLASDDLAGANMPVIVSGKTKIGKVQALSLTIEPAKNATPAEVEALRRMFGAAKLQGYAAVSGTRLVSTIGPGGKARLAALVAGAPSKKFAVDHNLAAALAESKGREGFGYLDLVPILRWVAGMNTGPQAAVMSALKGRIPLYGSYGGDGKGEVMTFELRLAKSAFAGIATAIQDALGGGLRF